VTENVAAADVIRQLIVRAGTQDQIAFRELVRRCEAKLLKTALGILGSQQDAEEVVQDAFLKVWRFSARYDASSRSSPISWLCVIVRNTSLDRLSQRRDGHEAISELLTESRPNPEQVCMERELSRHISLNIDSLEAKRAIAVKGAYLEGVSYAELATRQGLPINTIRTHVRRGMLELRSRCLHLN
jgi:RNA polymerase sigma-70 factor (ECF subfamily)